MMLKTSFRKQAKSNRDQIENTSERSEIIGAQLKSSKEYKNADDILLYSSIGSEVETHSLLASVLEEGKRLFLPKTNIHLGTMEFYQVYDLNELVAGFQGIMEPTGSRLYENSQGLMILPGLACDERGYRMGYGGGFYDRYLQNTSSRFTKIMIAYEAQVYSVIPTDNYDVPMDILISEEKTRIFHERMRVE